MAKDSGIRNVNWKNPRLQSVLIKQSQQQYKSSPDFASTLARYSGPELERLNKLREFGIRRKMAEKQLGFAKKMHADKMALERDKMDWAYADLKSASKGANIGMMLGIAGVASNVIAGHKSRQMNERYTKALEERNELFKESLTPQQAEANTIDPLLRNVIAPAVPANDWRFRN